MEADPSRASESQKNKIERLSKLDAQKKEIMKEEIKKAYYEKLKFKPKINKISKIIGKRTKVKEMADNSKAI